MSIQCRACGDDLGVLAPSEESRELVLIAVKAHGGKTLEAYSCNDSLCRSMVRSLLERDAEVVK